MAPPPRPVSKPRRLSLVGGLALAGLVLGAAGLFGPEWLARREAESRADEVDARAREAVAAFSKGLPRPHGPGLVLERVTLEGPALVLWIRVQGRTAAEGRRDPLMLEATQRGEQGLLLGFCKDPTVVDMLAQGLVISRRFLGSDYQPLFDVTLRAADCLADR